MPFQDQNMGMSLSSFHILLFFFLQNMTKLFITLFSLVFIYLYLTEIQYNLCLIKRAEYINDFSFRTLFFCLLIVIAPSFFCCCFFFNWDSPHVRLNSQYEAWSYKKKKHKKDYRIQKICLERTYS